MTCLLFIPDVDSFSDDTTLAWRLPTAQEPVNGTLANAALAIAQSKGGPVVALLPSSRVTFIETLLPPVAKAKRDALLRFAIEDKLTIDPSTVHAIVLDAAGRKSTSAKPEHVVAAVDREWFAAVITWLNKTLPSIAAIAPLSVMPHVDENEWALALDGDSFIVRDDGFAISIDQPVASPAESTGSTLAALPFTLSLAVSEARKQERAPQRINLVTHRDSVAAATIAESWANALHLPIRVQSSIGTAGSASSTADSEFLGRARRANLAVGSFAAVSGARRYGSALKPAWILGFVAFAIYLLGLSIDTWRLNREATRLQAQLRSVFMASFPQAQVVIDAPLQMSRNLQGLKRERGLAGGSEDPGRRLLNELAEKLRTANAPTPASVQFNEGMLTATINAANPVAAEALERALGAPLRVKRDGATVQVSLSASPTSPTGAR